MLPVKPRLMGTSIAGVDERVGMPVEERKRLISTSGMVKQKQRSTDLGKVRVTRLLQPHWRLMAIAFVALLAEGAADLLEPWPLKIIFDT